MDITRRQLSIGPHTLVADGPEVGKSPYIIVGPRMYAIGSGSGRIAPYGAEHLVGEMGGIWAHPLKVADGLEVSVCAEAGAAVAGAEGVFSESPAEVGWAWRCEDLRLSRRDRVLSADPPTPASPCPSRARPWSSWPSSPSRPRGTTSPASCSSS